MQATSYKVGNFQQGQTRSDLSRQWMARPADQRFLSLSDLSAAVTLRAEASAEIRVDTKSVELFAPIPGTIDDIHDLYLGLKDGTEIAPTHWSFGQLATLAKAPGGYLRTLPSSIAADAISYGLKFNRNNERVKLYHADGQLLAATGPDYGRIFDKEVVNAAMRVAGNGTGDSRWKIPGTLDWSSMTYDPNTPVTKDTTTLFASDRDVFIFLVDDRNPIEVGKLPNGDPDLMFRGFYITNSEVGSSSLRLAAFYLRAICCNRIMWGVEGFQEITMRHSKYAPSRFIEQARPALQSFADGSEARLLDGVRKAKAAKLASDDDEALEFLRRRDFSRTKALEILAAVERDEGRPARSAWDFAQGITRIAHDEINTDNRVAIEQKAGDILRIAA